ncbi:MULTISPECIES: MAG4270 family putative restriction endonuclease [Pseudoalteromonas]|uniref:HNH nuclease domain-containing protein n=1 Tax=Pseudoalteromonas lipolytica TaxID=570156 RepID=A0A0P7DS01_9GAMM|nr:MULTISPECIES: HNH endonuclease signature motif containing protein [Pseudoalteromonas]KPM83921.1 hypothetical protein AOG27_09780 [Pseudoalteromonas lipolytica]
MEHTKPIITIHPHSQKSRAANIGQNGIFWPDFISQQDLVEMCTLATGESEYTLIWLEEDQPIFVGGNSYKYNVGNIVTIAYKGKITYITFANPYNDGRNSYFQQVGPAYRRFLEDSSHNKSFMFYALPIERPENYGKVFTLYHHFMYSVLHAAGIGGNWQELLRNEPRRFQNIEQLIAARNRLSKNNNNASYVYFDSNEDAFYLFLKTYGASKYESFFLALAAINIEKNKEIRIRELEEGELTGLPVWAQNHIEQCSLGRVQCYSLEKGMDEHRAPVIMFPPSLRTPRYRVNVRKRCGQEICAFCDNDDPRDIQAAHVWDVHKLRQLSIENDDNRVLWDFASDGHNGLWLCTEHHRPFDSNTLLIDENGYIIYNTMISRKIIDELRATITKRQIDAEILTDEFRFYLQKRYEYVDLTLYRHL